jgi:hypothetical protein
MQLLKGRQYTFFSYLKAQTNLDKEMSAFLCEMSCAQHGQGWWSDILTA